MNAIKSILEECIINKEKQLHLYKDSSIYNVLSQQQKSCTEITCPVLCYCHLTQQARCFRNIQLLFKIFSYFHTPNNPQHRKSDKLG